MRDQLIDFLKKELIGPDPAPPLIQENGEEIIKEPPRLRYGAGILFPQAALTDNAEANNEAEAEIINQAAPEVEGTEGSDLSTDDRGSLSTGADDSLDANDETLTLANAFLPSALSVRVEPNCAIRTSLIIPPSRHPETRSFLPLSHNRIACPRGPDYIWSPLLLSLRH